MLRALGNLAKNKNKNLFDRTACFGAAFDRLLDGVAAALPPGRERSEGLRAARRAQQDAMDAWFSQPSVAALLQAYADRGDTQKLWEEWAHHFESSLIAHLSLDPAEASAFRGHGRIRLRSGVRRNGPRMAPMAHIPVDAIDGELSRLLSQTRRLQAVVSRLQLLAAQTIDDTRAEALVELNLQVAIFRDLLLGLGSGRDCPELRERIRKVRMDAMQAGREV